MFSTEVNNKYIVCIKWHGNTKEQLFVLFQNQISQLNNLTKH